MAIHLRTGKVFFFVRMLNLVSLPLLVFYLFHLKSRISVMQLLALSWLSWIMVVGKPGGIWHDEKFFYFSACFALFFLLVPLLRTILGSSYSRKIILPILCLSIIGGIEATIGVLQVYGLHPVFHSQFKVTGTFFNPAPFAAFLVGVLPFALFLSRAYRQSSTPIIRESQFHSSGRNKNISKTLLMAIKQLLISKKPLSWIGYLIIFSIIIVLPSTHSRAAYLGAISVLGVWAYFQYRPFAILNKWINRIWKKVLLYSTTSILLISFLGGLYLFKKDSASGRVLIWKVALRTIEKHPVSGYGFNTFQAIFAKEQSAYFAEQQRPEREEMLAGSAKWAFNEFLQTASETGVVGMIILLAIILYALWIGFVQKDIKDRYLAVSAGCSVLGIMVFGCFSYPFHSQPSTMTLFFSLSILAAQDNSKINIRINKEPLRVILNLIFLCITIVIITFLAVLYQEREQSYRIWNEAEMLYSNGAYIKANESFEEAYPVLKHHGLFLQKYGKSLSMSKQYNEAIRLLKEGELYYVDEVWFNTMGDSYKGIKKYDQAEEYYQMAADMVPHKFYPLYLLQKMYKETGELDKSKAMARKILNKRVKVHSIAIEEIRKEAELLIQDQ